MNAFFTQPATAYSVNSTKLWSYILGQEELVGIDTANAEEVVDLLLNVSEETFDALLTAFRIEADKVLSGKKTPICLVHWIDKIALLKSGLIDTDELHIEQRTDLSHIKTPVSLSNSAFEI